MPMVNSRKPSTGLKLLLTVRIYLQIPLPIFLSNAVLLVKC